MNTSSYIHTYILYKLIKFHTIRHPIIHTHTHTHTLQLHTNSHSPELQVQCRFQILELLVQELENDVQSYNRIPLGY